MAFQLVSADTDFVVGSAGLASLPINTPKKGALMICGAWGNGAANSNALTTNGITAFSKVDVGINTNGADGTLFYKIADGIESLLQLTASGGAGMNLQYMNFTGSANPAVLETSNTSTSGAVGVTTLATGVISTILTGDLVVVVSVTNNANGGAFGGFATSTTVNVNQTNKLIMGYYLPGTKLTGFSDAATWATSRNASTIAAAFKPVFNPANRPRAQAIQRASNW